MVRMTNYYNLLQYMIKCMHPKSLTVLRKFKLTAWTKIETQLLSFFVFYSFLW